MSFRTGEHSGLPPRQQFTFNESDGTIELANGKKYIVQISQKEDFRNLGKDNAEIILMITNMLDQVGQENDFEYKDLSQTAITYEGVTTDQKESTPRTYKIATYDSQYASITRTAQEAMANLPKSPTSSRRLRGISMTGQEPSDLTSEQQPVTSSSSDVSPPPAASATQSYPAEDGTTSTVTHEQAAIGGSSEQPARRADGVEISEVTVTVSREVPPLASGVHAATTIRFQPAESDSASADRQPTVQPKSKIKQQWDKCLNWLSSTRFGPRIFISLADRAAEHEARIRSHGLRKTEDEDEIASQLGVTTVEMTEKEMIQVTLDNDFVLYFRSEAELQAKYSPERIKEKKTVQMIDYTEISLEQLDKVLADVVRYDAKIKRKRGSERGRFILRAGHRKTRGKSQKKVGTSKRSHKVIKGLANAINTHNNRITARNGSLVKAKSMVDELGKERDRGYYDINIAHTIECAETFANLHESQVLSDFIESAKAYQADKSDGNWSDLEAIITALKQEYEEGKIFFKDAIITEARTILAEIELVRSIVNQLNTSIWGKNVLEKSGIKTFKNARNMLVNYTKPDIEKMIDSLNEMEEEKLPDFMSLDAFLSEMLKVDNKEMREDFSANFRWYMTSDKYLTTLKERFTINQEKLSAEPAPDADEIARLKDEQNAILLMVEDWAKSIKTLEEDQAVHQLFKGEAVDDEKAATAHAVLQEFLAIGKDEQSPYHEKMAAIQTALTNPPQPVASPETSDTEASHLSEIQRLVTGEDIDRDTLVTTFASDLSIMMTNQYLQIQPSELTDAPWEKARTQHLAPNVMKSTQLFNRVSHVCQYLILTAEPSSGGPDRRVTKPEEQARAIEFMMDVIIKLIDDGDLNTAMAVNSALNATPINQLRIAWSKIDEQKLAQFNEKCNVISTESNFKLMRERLRENPNTIPYLGKFFGDLLFIKENRRIKESDGSLNTFFWGLVSGASRNVLRGQKGKTVKATQANIARDFESLHFDSGEDAMMTLSQLARK